MARKRCHHRARRERAQLVEDFIVRSMAAARRQARRDKNLVATPGKTRVLNATGCTCSVLGRMAPCGWCESQAGEVVDEGFDDDVPGVDIPGP